MGGLLRSKFSIKHKAIFIPSISSCAAHEILLIKTEFIEEGENFRHRCRHFGSSNPLPYAILKDSKKIS